LVLRCFFLLAICKLFAKCTLNIIRGTLNFHDIPLNWANAGNLCLLSYQYLHGLKSRSNWPFSLAIGGALSENQINLAPNVFYNTAQSFLPGLLNSFAMILHEVRNVASWIQRTIVYEVHKKGITSHLVLMSF
jgi:hypothetical protein